MSLEEQKQIAEWRERWKMSDLEKLKVIKEMIEREMRAKYESK